MYRVLGCIFLYPISPIHGWLPSGPSERIEIYQTCGRNPASNSASLLPIALRFVLRTHAKIAHNGSKLRGTVCQDTEKASRLPTVASEPSTLYLACKATERM